MLLPGVKLTAQAAFTLKTVTSDATCEGIPIDGAPTGQQWCWTGGVKWKEDGIMDGFFEGSYDSTSATPAKIQFYEVMASGQTESLLYMSNADETNTMTKVSSTCTLDASKSNPALRSVGLTIKAGRNTIA